MRTNVFQDRLNESLGKFRDNIAIEYGNRTVTYVELERRSASIAGWILDRSLKKETFIGVLADDRAAYIAAIIGVIRAGCVFVALDSVNPVDRLKKMAAVTHLDLILIDEESNNKFSTGDFVKNGHIEFVIIEDLFAYKSRRDDITIPDMEYSSEDKIYIYFTSGSTGLPRAVVGKNKSLLHYIEWEVDTFTIDERFRISQFSNPGFDAFLKELFVALFSGGTLCIPESMDTILTPLELATWLEESRISLLHCVPSLFRVLNSGVLTADRFPNLRYILLSGEKVFPSDLKKWYDIFDERIQIVNLYGTTETTILKTCYFINKFDVNRKIIPIGTPIRGSRMIILDENMNVCNKNISGEIYIRTPYLTSGYYNDPQLTQKRFIQNPFNDKTGDIIYRTGDLGRLLVDGEVELLGRIDRQVKIRGNRIELEEIENTLLNYKPVDDSNAQINDVYVMGREVEEDNDYLCAYYVSDKEFTVSQLRDYLSNELPEYMIPAHFVWLDKKPLLPNGKINTHALPDPVKEMAESKASPRNQIEETLVDIWSEVLKIDKGNIGIYTNFFELGGHSLNVMSLISIIHREFDVRVPVGDIFNNPTIERQGIYLSESSKEEYASIPPAEQREYYVISSAQKRLYIWQQMNPESTVYNMAHVVVMEGEAEADILEKTFGKLIKRHEVLRTSFEMIEGEVVQRVYENVLFEVEYYELKNDCEQTANEAAIEIDNILQSFVRPFDLSLAPLLRVGLIKAGKGKYIMMADTHHIISDGASNNTLVQDFTVLRQGEELPELKLQYKDFSQWQYQEKETIKHQEKYWLDMFDGEIPVLNLPTDIERPDVQSFEGGTVDFIIDEEETEALKTLALKEGVTLYILLLTTFNVLLSRLSGQEDIIVGVPAAGRRHTDLENIIGFFINTLPLRNYPSGEKSFSEFLKEVKANSLNAFENQDYPFDDIVEKLDIDRDMNRNPLFNVIIEIINLEPGHEEVESPAVERGEVKAEMRTLSHQTYQSKAPYELDFGIVYLGKYMSAKVLYRKELFKEETIQRFVDYFKDLLSSLIEHSDIKLKDMKISHDFVDIQTNFLESEQGDFGF